MGLLTVLTGGILITAAKTHKEIQRVLLNKQQFWSVWHTQLPLFHTVEVSSNSTESKFWYK